MHLDRPEFKSWARSSSVTISIFLGSEMEIMSEEIAGDNAHEVFDTNQAQFVLVTLRIVI